MSKMFLPALIAAISLAAAPLPALADKGGRGNGNGGWRGDGFCPPGLARRDPACVPPGQARREAREDDSRDWLRQVEDDRDREDRDDNAGAAIAIVGALMGLALIERAARDREDSDAEPAAVDVPWEPPEIPARPDTLALLSDPSEPTAVPEASEFPRLTVPPTGSSLIPPPPAMASIGAPTSEDLAEAFERAQTSGQTGF